MSFKTSIVSGESLSRGTTRDNLAEWLLSNGIDISNWGSGTAKTVDSLLGEINQGEVILQDNPPLRVVSIARVLVTKGDKVLVEGDQLLNDGRVRRRNRPPSEKMKPEETYMDAAVRCLEEELNISSEDIQVLSTTYSASVSEAFSPSYPGLNTKYVIHSVDAIVQNLPDTDFWTKEKRAERYVDVEYHIWRWVNRHDLPSTSFT